MVDHNLITTSNSLEGYKVTQQLGVVRGITVRSRSILGNIAGGLQSVFGGESCLFMLSFARKQGKRHIIEW